MEPDNPKENEITPNLVAVIEDRERSLDAGDVAAVVDVPAVAVARDPAVARAIDAGLFGVRRPRGFALQIRTLVDWVARTAVAS